MGMNVARLEEGRSAFKILTCKPAGKRPLESPGIDGMAILAQTFKKKRGQYEEVA